MKAIWLLLLLAGPAMAQENPTDAEICVRHAMTLITGQPVMGFTEADYAMQLRYRAATCSDPSYMQAAAQRVQNLQTQAQALAQLQQEHEVLAQRLAQEQANADADRRAERAQRFSQTMQNIANQQQEQRNRVQAARPVQTSCHQTISGMDCTTN